jgi:8-oxo-dGTP pyrophosphatase MutT (NUDIX family)
MDVRFEAGETADAALIREVREECGWEIDLLGRFANAVQYVFAPDEGFFAKQSAFYRIIIGGVASQEVEDDYKTMWLEISDAIEQLSQESHAWAVSQAVQHLTEAR